MVFRNAGQSRFGVMHRGQSIGWLYFGLRCSVSRGHLCWRQGSCDVGSQASLAGFNVLCSTVVGEDGPELDSLLRDHVYRYGKLPGR